MTDSPSGPDGPAREAEEPPPESPGTQSAASPPEASGQTNAADRAPEIADPPPSFARVVLGVVTTTLLAGMIGLAYLALRSFGEAGETEKRFASGLSVIAIPVLPLIHYSVKRWRGVHPTVITSSGGGLHPDMYPALGAGFALFTCLVGVLVWLRYRAERNHERALELTLRSLEREAAEEA